MNHSEMQFVRFLGVKIDNVNYSTVYETIMKSIDAKGYICLTDAGNVICAYKDKDFCAAINESLISIADGMPLAWYAKLIECRRIKRISGMELMRRLIEEGNKFKHFLLGDTERTINEIIYRAKQVNNKLHISGYSPPFKHEFDENDNMVMLNKINEENPDIVWVSFGGGKQDKWMYRNINNLNRGVMIGVGAAFRFYIGKIRTPPKIVQNLGLQWVTRTLQQPCALKRQLRLFPKFMFFFPREVVRARRKQRELRTSRSRS